MVLDFLLYLIFSSSFNLYCYYCIGELSVFFFMDKLIFGLMQLVALEIFPRSWYNNSVV